MHDADRLKQLLVQIDQSLLDLGHVNPVIKRGFSFCTFEPSMKRFFVFLFELLFLVWVTCPENDVIALSLDRQRDYFRSGNAPQDDTGSQKRVGLTPSVEMRRKIDVGSRS